MTKFEKLREILKDYMSNADQHYSRYQEREKNARAKYSEAGYQDEFMKKIYPEMAGKAWAEKDAAIQKVNEIFDDIEKEFKTWLMKPLDESTTQVLEHISRYDLSLSLGELRVLEESVKGSYWGMKIFSGISEKNGYHVNAPSMKQFQDALKSARSNATLSVRAYAGRSDSKFMGRDLLPKWERDGLVLGDYDITHMLYACEYLEKGQIDRLEEMFSESRAPMVYRLKEEEEKNVRQGVESIIKDGEIDKKAAHDLIKKDPDFSDKLSSMPNEFFADKESLIGFFGLDKKEESFESKIDTATKKAAEGGAKFSKIDPQTLSSFS